MTLEEANKRLATLYNAAKQSTKIKSDPLAWALKQLLALAIRAEKEEAGDDKGKATEKGR